MGGTTRVLAAGSHDCSNVAQDRAGSRGGGAAISPELTKEVTPRKANVRKRKTPILVLVPLPFTLAVVGVLRLTLSRRAPTDVPALREAYHNDCQLLRLFRHYQLNAVEQQ